MLPQGPPASGRTGQVVLRPPRLPATVPFALLEHREWWNVSALETGPAWNVEEFPSSYNGAPIQWDPERYDTAAMPFIVSIRQHFWSWRITRFAAATGLLEVDLALPSVMPDGMTMIGFDPGDEPPAALLDEFVQLLGDMGRVMLDNAWTYRLQASDGARTEVFEGTFGGAEDDA